MQQQILQLKELMEKRGFEVVALRTAAEAKDYLLSRIPNESSVGAGGSVSVRDTNVLTALRERGNAVYTSWGAKAEDIPKIYENARVADVYLSSANAITKDGRLVFIDGICNRVGAILDGPAQVYFVVSVSKLVDGGINTAVARIKRTACPQNARRLKLNTPCAATGMCKSDICENSMCRATVVIDRVPRKKHMTVLLMEEALGY